MLVSDEEQKPLNDESEFVLISSTFLSSWPVSRTDILWVLLSFGWAFQWKKL